MAGGLRIKRARGSQARREGHPPGTRPPPSTSRRPNPGRSAPGSLRAAGRRAGSEKRRKSGPDEARLRSTAWSRGAGHTLQPHRGQSSTALLPGLAMPTLGGVSFVRARDCLHEWKVVEGPRVAGGPAMTALSFCRALSSNGVQKPAGKGQPRGGVSVDSHCQ